MKKLTNIIISLTFVVAYLLVGIVIFWETYSYKPLVFNKNPAEILTPVVYAGKSLQYKVDYCKNTSLFAKVSTKFINEISFQLPPTVGTHTKGCGTDIIQKSIPSDLPSGTYYLQMDYTYQINPIREVNVKLTTETFRVINIEK